MWAAASLLALASPKASAAPAHHSSEAQVRSCSETTWSQGPEDAELVLRLWIDPNTKGSGGGGSTQYAFDAWLAMRNVVVDRGASARFRLEVGVARRRTGGADSTPQARETRLLFMALLENLGPSATLRAMTRSAGFDLELATRRPDALERLLGELGLSAADLDRSEATTSCRAQRLDRSRLYLDKRLGTRAGGFPVIELEAKGQRPRFVQDANSRAAEVRSMLDQMMSPRSSSPPPDFEIPSGPKSITPAPELARTYPGYGMLVGGPGLHHHLLVLADDERSSVLPRTLPTILSFVAEHPGRMSVQLLGVGSGAQAKSFSQRMCGARQLGLELAYLRYLAIPEKEREELDPDLVGELEAAAQTAKCPESELPELQREAPKGDSRRRRGTPLASLLQSRDLWLDGLPSTTAEVERLPMLLALPPATPSAWRMLWAPAETEP
jgi:hypothetical protein